MKKIALIILLCFMITGCSNKKPDINENQIASITYDDNEYSELENLKWNHTLDGTTDVFELVQKDLSGTQAINGVDIYPAQYSDYSKGDIITITLSFDNDLENEKIMNQVYRYLEESNCMDMADVVFSIKVQ